MGRRCRSFRRGNPWDLAPLGPKSRRIKLCRGECQALHLLGCKKGSLLPTRQGMTDEAAETGLRVWSGLGSEFDVSDAVARKGKPGSRSLGCRNGAVEETRGNY